MVGVQRGLLILMAAGAIALGPSAPKTSQGVPDEGTPAQASYQVDQKEFYIDPGTLWGLQPGLKFTLVSVTNVAGGQKPVIRFKVTDDLNRPLDRLGQLTPGTIAIRYTVSTWDGHYYNNLIHSGGNPSRDSAGPYTDNAIGDYTYTSSVALPAFDNTGPVTLFVGVRRTVTDVLGKDYFVNYTKDFIPSTGAAATNWSVTTTAKCNACHDPLALHGGNYREAKVCALCHNPNDMTGASLKDFNGQVFWHAIHSSNNEEIGEITFPQRDSPSPGMAGNSRNCEACHDTTGTVDKVGVWYAYPTRAACGGCHAEINWATGAGHSDQNIPQADDSACATCHPPQGTDEYDTSIKNAHIVPSDSKQLKGLTVTILSATNVGPGKKPTVTFKITQNDGKAISPSASGASTLSLTMAGSTLDYNTPNGTNGQPFSENALNAAYDATTGICTYTFTIAMPATAKGTWTFSSQYRRTVVLTKAVGGTISFTEGGPNPIFDVSVDGSAVKARRATVTLAKCNACHDRLANLFSHGGQRISIQFCVQCHAPPATDVARRPADGSANPPEGISFAHMIHRIHTGEELTNTFTVYGFGGAASVFNEVTYPGDRRNCLACHISFTPSTSATNPTTGISPPMPAGTLNVVTPRDMYSPQGTASAACLGCHDAEDYQAHAYINTAVFPSGNVAEACGACHGANSDLAPSKVHAR
jgi:OmcA/MtrC family decaheme c-type cytochrome